MSIESKYFRKERVVQGGYPMEILQRPEQIIIVYEAHADLPAGTYRVPCALIIGQRKESTDKKTSLNAALRDFGVSV